MICKNKKAYINFDYIRFFLALLVMFEHYGYRIFADIPGLSWFNGDEAVFCFFIISGYFITLSYLNSKDLESYLIKRIKRIYPPIIAITLFCVVLGLVIGLKANWYRSVFNFLFFNNLSVPTLYLEGSTSQSYFLKIFKNPPFWSLIIELHFYLLLPILLSFRKHKYFKLLLLFIIGASICLKLLIEEAALQNLNERSLTQQNLLFYLDYFGLGIFVALYQKDSLKQVLANNVRASWGDLSYGVYIYHWVVMDIYKGLGFNHNIYIMSGITLFISFLSWHLLEKKMVKR